MSEQNKNQDKKSNKGKDSVQVEEKPELVLVNHCFEN